MLATGEIQCCYLQNSWEFQSLIVSDVILLVYEDQIRFFFFWFYSFGSFLKIEGILNTFARSLVHVAHRGHPQRAGDFMTF